MKRSFNKMLRLSILGCCLVLVLCCKKKSQFVLEKVEFNKELKGDTVGRYLLGNLVLVKVRDYGYLGEFKNQFIFIKKTNLEDRLSYKIKDENFDVKIAENAIYLVNENDNSFGWFYIQKGRILPKLPQIDSIAKVIENSDKNKFVRENNGIFSIFEDGEIIDKLNYGSFFLNDKLDFDTLKFGVYKVTNKTLIEISNDGRDLLKQIDGLYYVPYPGYNINRYYDLKKISHVLDSVALIKKRPNKIVID